jgi:hypothetical protein
VVAFHLEKPFTEPEAHELLGASDTLLARLAFACKGTSSYSAVLGVELEQPLQRRSYMRISQRPLGSISKVGFPGSRRSVA